MKLFNKKKVKYNAYEEALMIFTAEVKSGRLDSCFEITENHDGDYITYIKYVFNKLDHIFNNLEFVKILNYHDITTRIYHGIINNKKINYCVQNQFAEALEAIAIRKSTKIQETNVDVLKEYIKKNK